MGSRGRTPHTPAGAPKARQPPAPAPLRVAPPAAEVPCRPQSPRPLQRGCLPRPRRLTPRPTYRLGPEAVPRRTPGDTAAGTPGPARGSARAWAPRTGATGWGRARGRQGGRGAARRSLVAPAARGGASGRGGVASRASRWELAPAVGGPPPPFPATCPGPGPLPPRTADLTGGVLAPRLSGGQGGWSALTCTPGA